MGDYAFISDNISSVLENIKFAAQRAKKSPEDITLINVSKTKPIEMLLAAYDSGSRNFGENKVQEIIAKAPLMPEDTVWHMIGHLQKNKVKKAVATAEMIHSVDSAELALLINDEAEKIDKKQKILLEINIANEDTKYGLGLQEVIPLVRQLSKLENIEICGLMCVAPFTEVAEENRVYFKNMHDLLLDINSLKLDNVNMNVLSMGMSGDYEIAIEEGATHVRVGTSIFGERDYAK